MVLIGAAFGVMIDVSHSISHISNMASEEEQTEEQLKSALDFLALQGFNRKLKDKQKEAVMQILRGGDLLAILPTGFGKSLVFQMVRLDRPCDLPAEKHRWAKRFKFKQKCQT